MGHGWHVADIFVRIGSVVGRGVIIIHFIYSSKIIINTQLMGDRKVSLLPKTLVCIDYLIEKIILIMQVIYTIQVYMKVTLRTDFIVKFMMDYYFL